MANDDKRNASSVEVHFAQRLAANEKKIRDRAMRKLRKWLEVKSVNKKENAFTEGDLLKIWKGLHYCLWMQDKPLLQEEMCAFISRLVHVFSDPDTTLLFIQVYLQTQTREWQGIDRWRMDKFMMLFRNMLTESLLFLKKQKWKKSLVTKFTDILTSKILTTDEEKSPDGLKIHLSDIFLDELEKAGAEELSPQKVISFLQPFLHYTQTSKNMVIVSRVLSRVFEGIIEQTVNDAMSSAEKQLEKEEEGDQEEDITNEEDEDMPIRLQFDFKALADKLFELGSSEECRVKNRKILYQLVKKFQDLDDGILPKEEVDEEIEEITKKDLSAAVQGLEKLDPSNYGKKKRKKKKKKNLQDEDEEDENLNDSGYLEEEKKAKKKKRKMKSDESSTEKDESSNPKKRKEDAIVNDVNQAPSAKKRNKNKKNTKNDSENDNEKTDSNLNGSTSEKVSNSILDGEIENASVLTGEKSMEVDISKKNVETSSPGKSTGNGKRTEIKISENNTEDRSSLEVKTPKGKKGSNISKELTNVESDNVTNRLDSSLSLSSKKKDKRNRKNIMESPSKNLETDFESAATENGSSELKEKVESEHKSVDKVVDKTTPEKGKDKIKRKSSASVESEVPKDLLFLNTNTESENVEITNGGQNLEESTSGITGKKRRKSSIALSSTPSASVVEALTPSSMNGPLTKKTVVRTRKSISTPVTSKIVKTPTVTEEIDGGGQSKSNSFAKLDTFVKTPPAFVRKAVSKLTTPKSTPKAKQIPTVAPSTCPSDPKKKVIFNMKRNESLSFQESIKFSPDVFNPASTPDHGILKTPSPAVTRSQTRKKRASTGGRSKAADFF